MRDFKNLKTYQLADALALAISQTATGFLRGESRGVILRLRRASVSILNNIAEGAGRQSDSEYVRFLNIASRSAAEVEYLLGLVRRLGYLGAHDHERLQASTGVVVRSLAGLVQSIEGASKS